MRRSNPDVYKRQGYVSAYMATDMEKMEAVLDDPYILITDKKILSLIHILEMPQDGLRVCPDSGGCIRRSGKPEAPCGSHRSADPSHSQILRRP